MAHLELTILRFIKWHGVTGLSSLFPAHAAVFA